MENRVLNERLEKLYMEYIGIEKKIRRLKEIKEQYTYRLTYANLRTKKKVVRIVENDVERSDRFKRATLGCNKFYLDDPFWTAMSSVFGIPRNECYNKWVNEVEEWDRKLTKSDVERVRSLRREGKDWVEMCREMRCPPFRMFCEYVRCGSASKLKMWMAEEDRLLEQGVAEHGTSRWRFVSRVVGTRTGKECAMRFYFLNKNVKKGRWSVDEEERLAEAVGMHGEGRWRDISNHVMTRNPIQCRTKYFDEVRSQGRRN